MNTNGKDFSFDEIEDFDSHIELSIPNYIALREYIISLSSYFCKGGRVYDIGCSTGVLIGKLSDKYEGHFIGMDISDNLLGKHCPKKSNIEFINQDVFMASFEPMQLAISVFTLQFIPEYKRPSIVKNLYNSLEKGGALLVAEKVNMQSGFMQDIFTFCHYDYKHKTFDSADIMGKQYALRKIMRPNTEAENIKMFTDAGFSRVECFWQSLLFKAWLCIE